eukprot:6214522-Pleurochrysis_carterae.AAC.1
MLSIREHRLVEQSLANERASTYCICVVAGKQWQKSCIPTFFRSCSVRLVGVRQEQRERSEPMPCKSLNPKTRNNRRLALKPCQPPTRRRPR